MDQETISLSNIRNKSEYTFIDNLTIFHSEEFFNEIQTPSGKFSTEYVSSLSRDPQKSAILGLIEALVLCDKCLVDHFTLLASSTCQRLMPQLGEIITPVYIPKSDRCAIHNDLMNMKLSKRTKTALSEELQLTINGYYQDEKPKSINMPSAENFVSKYYEPSDAHKSISITSGVYSPLNLGRTYFYILLARQSGLPYMPHPWRESLVSTLTNIRRPFAVEIVNYINRHITEGIRKEIHEMIPSVESSVVPPIAFCVLRRAQEPKYIMEALVEMRNNKRARLFRSWCCEFREALSEGAYGTRKTQKMWLSLNKVAEIWKKDLDEEVRYRTRTIKFGLGPPGIQLKTDEIGIKIPVIFTTREYRPLLFLNDIFRPVKKKK